MLVHSSKVLLQAIAEQAQNSFQEIKASAPVAWDWEGANFRQKAELSSSQSLSLPAPTLRSAQIRVQSPIDAQPETYYQSPRLNCHLLDPQNTVQETLVIPGGLIKTPAKGRLNQFLQEYLATILNFELSVWKFSCRRDKQSLEISAGAERAGWNLQVVELSYDSEANLPWSGGLYEGLSSLDPNQQAGQIGFLSWGPYIINSQRCEISLPLSDDPNAFAVAFLAHLNRSLAATGIQADWNAEGKLTLLQHHRDRSIEVLQAENPPARKPPHHYLALDLAPGKHEALNPGKQESLTLNGVKIDLPTPPQELSELSDWFIETVNAWQETTGVMSSLGADQVLVLHSLKSFEPISLSGLSAWLKKCTGLSETLSAEQHKLQTIFEQWMRLLNALGQEAVWQANLPIESCLSQQSYLLSWVPPCWEWKPQLLKQTEELALFVNQILLYAQSFIEPSKKQPISPEHNNAALLEPPPLKEPGSTSPTQAKPLEAEHPKPSFDHKI